MSEEQMYEPPMYDVGVEIRNMKAELVKLQSECAIARKREQDAWAERDQYMNSNVKLVAEIERLRDENQRYATAHKQLQAALREKEIEVDRLHYHYTNGKKGNPHWLPGEGMPP